MRYRSLMWTTASAVALAGLTAGAAYAQDNAAANNTDSTTVGEVIVTAQKREQRLEDVPIVVTVAGKQLLQDAGVNDIRQLTILTPGLTVTSTSNETIVTARVRGIGTVGDNPGLESSVGVVIDGVYRPRNGVSFGDLGDVSRIEVLKGPQGTLFGKNTSAGVINVITSQPTFVNHGEGEITIGNYNQIGGSLTLSGPLVAEKLAGSLFLVDRRRDGYMDIVTGQGPRTMNDDVDQNFWSSRAQLLYQPNDRLSARLIGDYTSRNEHCCAATQVWVGTQAASPRARGLLLTDTVPGSIDLTNTPYDRLAYSNRDTDTRTHDKGLSLEVSYDINDEVQVTSVTAQRVWKVTTAQDADYSTADIIYRPNDHSHFNKFDDFSQELRFSGAHGKLNWLVGGFYAAEDLQSNVALNYGKDYYAFYAQRVLSNVPALIGLTPAVVFQPGNGQRDYHSQQDRTWALFTNESYKITDALELTVGLRYTSDTKKLNSTYTTTGGSCDQAEALLAAGALASLGSAATTIVGGLCLNLENQDFDRLGLNQQKLDDSDVSGTAKLAYRFTPDFMSYISYSRGFKAGGFNLDREQLICTAAVTSGPCVDNRTAAQKLKPLDFFSDPDTSFPAETVDSYELGFKTQWFNRRLLVNAAAFYQRYQDFQLNTFASPVFIVETLPEVTSTGVDADIYWQTPVRGLGIQGGITYANTKIGDFVASDLRDPSKFNSLFRLPGRRIGFAPLWSISLAGTWEHDMSDTLQLRANLSGKWVSDYNTGSDLNPLKEQKAYTVVNARVGIGRPDDRWRLEAWAQNLFDQDYKQVVFDAPYQVVPGTPAAPSSGDNLSVLDAFLGAPATYGLTLRSKF